MSVILQFAFLQEGFAICNRHNPMILYDSIVFARGLCNHHDPMILYDSIIVEVLESVEEWGALLAPPERRNGTWRRSSLFSASSVS